MYESWHEYCITSRDIFDEVFFHFFFSLYRKNTSYSNVSPFLFRICHRRWWDSWHSRSLVNLKGQNSVDTFSNIKFYTWHMNFHRGIHVCECFTSHEVWQKSSHEFNLICCKLMSTEDVCADLRPQLPRLFLIGFPLRLLKLPALHPVAFQSIITWNWVLEIERYGNA